MKDYKLQPFITIEQILAFRPDEPATHTASPIVNAVATVLFETHVIRVVHLAKLLGVDLRALTGALQISTGMGAFDLLHEYRIAQAMAYVEAHPDQSLEEAAHALGYASYNALWRFFQRTKGITPYGKESHAGPERWRQIRDSLSKGR